MTPDPAAGWTGYGIVVLAAVGVLLLAAFVLLLRVKPGRAIGGGDLQEVNRRVDGLQVHLAGLPDGSRVGAIEHGLGVMQAQLSALTEGGRRQERMLEMVMAEILRREERPCPSGSD